MREYFMKTERIGFSIWKEEDLPLAVELWGDKDVTKFICATGIFTEEDIKNRLELEVYNNKEFNIQYWPIFNLETGELIGCSGVRPFKDEKNCYEMGVHLSKKYWGKGYASEAVRAVISYCFNELNAYKLYAGHHPQNEKSKRLLIKVGFNYIGENFYEPTGLYHPSYEMYNKNYK